MDVGYAEWKRGGKVDPKVFGLATGRMALLFAQQDGSAHPKLWLLLPGLGPRVRVRPPCSGRIWREGGGALQWGRENFSL